MIDVRIREERDTDPDSIRAVNTAAFGQPTEAMLVDTLRSDGDTVISLVAEQVPATEVVAHLLLSRARVQGFDSSASWPCLALAPMAVLPPHQGRGLGSALVRRSLELARERGHGFVVVLGHPTYYPRFGFEPAGARGIACPYPAPDEAFMVAELRAGALDGVRGTMTYAPAFASLDDES